MQELHPNVVLIHRFFQAYGENNLNEIKSLLAPDIQWHIPGVHALSGTKNGAEEVLQYFREIGKFGFQAKPIVLGVNDDYVIDCHSNWATSKEGDRIEFMSCLLWKIKDGKISSVHNFQQDQHLVDKFFIQSQLDS